MQCSAPPLLALTRTIQARQARLKQASKSVAREAGGGVGSHSNNNKISSRGGPEKCSSRGYIYMMNRSDLLRVTVGTSIR